MDFMKVFDQTVREIKREVNLKVLKVPEIEQKVLDATDNEPWGPHGSALAEIAQGTKKLTECQMIMNVLWTRLSETGKDWRHVYKALAVIEYLVAHGSERAVDDIIEHTFQISSLSSFEYVEPNGKDSGINVRKKVETIVSLLNNRDKIQEVRNKAASNRDKYVGLSSTGMTYKSGSAFSGSGGSFQSSDRYGGMSGTREVDRFRDIYRDRDRNREDKSEKYISGKSRQGKTSKMGSTHHGSHDEDNVSYSGSGSSTRFNNSDMNSSSLPSDRYNDDFDDFDPRGTGNTKSELGNSNQVDLFGQSFVGDLLDAPTSVPVETYAADSNPPEVDLFADADFVSASPQIENVPKVNSHVKTEVDLFASEPTITPAVSSTLDLFSTPDPIVRPETNVPKSDATNTNLVDPFAALPLNNFDGSDPFGAFATYTDPASTEPLQSSTSEALFNTSSEKTSADSKPPNKKDAFQVKSGIWADSLSRGLIDLNIAAPKKVSLADVGIVGGLTDGSDEKVKGLHTDLYMGRSMGAGSGLGRSDFTSSQAIGDDFFSSLSSTSEQYQYGSFKK